MIFVFVVDTSPSMSERLSSHIGMCKLDLAKMAVESLTKSLSKRLSDHSISLQQKAQLAQMWHAIGLGFVQPDQLFLLSTSRQNEDSKAMAGGRLLVGWSDQDSSEKEADQSIGNQNAATFDKELKSMKVSEQEGGTTGLNTALSFGLNLMMRYRLKNRSIENFGLGRLPSDALGTNTALQPACLILLTDGEALKSGKSLQLHFGARQPLKEFYLEPFRWDQRIFCVGIGDTNATSTQYLHSSLRALCEVTGGNHILLKSPSSLSSTTDTLLNLIAPTRPKLPIPDPLNFPRHDDAISQASLPPGLFVNGGPVCCFQQLEAINGAQSPTDRAMVLYVPHQTRTSAPCQPTWCLPESFWPSKKLDTLPPRLAQPLLTYSSHYNVVGSNFFDPSVVMKMLARLDQLVIANRKLCQKPSVKGQPDVGTRLLSRDTYICHWLTEDSSPSSVPSTLRGKEYFPICMRGGGRPLTEGENMLNIGILHVTKRLTTLSLLPPEPHILLPLLLKAAEAEQRSIKRHSNAEGKLINPRSLNVMLDENWRSEMRAYFFRIPPYYMNSVKRALRPILPVSVQAAFLGQETVESIMAQCFSKTCHQKIRNAEVVSKEQNEVMERQEALCRGKNRQVRATSVGYGQYDPRGTRSSYLSALRHLPAPWKAKGGVWRQGTQENVGATTIASTEKKSALDILGDLPGDCLMAYYESRRRWIFGGSGLATRGLFVEGCNNDGTNVQRVKKNHSEEDESLLALAGVGVNTVNEMPIAKMGDFRERLLWSRAPIVGYGSAGSCGVAATTAPNGSPQPFVTDDVLPVTFFDPSTGEFDNSVQARVRSRLTIHFGNPFKDKRGDSICPTAYTNQLPPSRKRSGFVSDKGPTTPPGSPPHDGLGVDGEGEAIFAEHKSRRIASKPESTSLPVSDSQKREADDLLSSTGKRVKTESNQTLAKAPPPKPPTPRNLKQKPPAPPTNQQRKPPPPKPIVDRRTSSLNPRAPPPPRRPSSLNPPPPRAHASSAARPPAPPKPRAKPPAPPPKPTTLSKPVQKKTVAGPSNAAQQSPNVKPDVDLPPGWMSVWSKTQKRWYFFDTKRKKSVWQWPPPGGLP